MDADVWMLTYAQDLLRLVDGVGEGEAHGDEAELQGYSLLGQGGGAQGCF